MVTFKNPLLPSQPAGALLLSTGYNQLKLACDPVKRIALTFDIPQHHMQWLLSPAADQCQRKSKAA